MRVINSIIECVLYTSILTACCAVGLCMATERLLIDHLPPLVTALHTLIFGSTLWVYNTHILIKKARPGGPGKIGWAARYRYWHILVMLTGLFMSIGSLIVFFVYYPALAYKILLGCAVLGGLSFAYSLPLLPFKNKKRLKDFGWVKILTLDGVWTIVTTILPILYWDESIAAYPYEILIRFVFIFVICVAFDIRDMQVDLEADIHTLPNLIGLKNSYRLMDLTILLFALLSVVQYIHFPSTTRLVGALLSAAATKWAVTYTRKHPTDKAYLGLVDGAMLFYAIMVMFY